MSSLLLTVGTHVQIVPWGEWVIWPKIVSARVLTFVTGSKNVDFSYSKIKKTIKIYYFFEFFMHLFLKTTS